MKFANTAIINGVETVTAVIPLSAVPAFDPNNPPPNAYQVSDFVTPGWYRGTDGAFNPPRNDTTIQVQLPVGGLVTLEKQVGLLVGLLVDLCSSLPPEYLPVWATALPTMDKVSLLGQVEAAFGYTKAIQDSQIKTPISNA